MIKNASVMLLTLSISIQAMEQTKQLTIKDLQHKCNVLKEELESKVYTIWMWDPITNGFHAIYQAKNNDDLTKVVRTCSPLMRIKEKYSLLGIITIAPNIIIQDRKNTIKTLSDKGYTPTTHDKELAIVEAWERCDKEKIIRNISLLFCAYTKNPSTLFKLLPREIIHDIALLVFEKDTFEAELLL